MLEHFKGDEVFCRQIMDIKERVEDQYISQVTPFLDPHQQEIVASFFVCRKICARSCTYRRQDAILVAWSG